MKQFVVQAAAWQRQLGEDQRRFCIRIGRFETEWAAIRHNRRSVSQSFAAAVLQAAPEPWRSALVRAYLADVEAKLLDKAAA